MKELNDKLKADGSQHFIDENTTTTEFSEDVIFSIRTEELTREEIIKKYSNYGQR